MKRLFNLLQLPLILGALLMLSVASVSAAPGVEGSFWWEGLPSYPSLTPGPQDFQMYIFGEYQPYNGPYVNGRVAVGANVIAGTGTFGNLQSTCSAGVDNADLVVRGDLADQDYSTYNNGGVFVGGTNSDSIGSGTGLPVFACQIRTFGNNTAGNPAGATGIGLFTPASSGKTFEQLTNMNAAQASLRGTTPAYVDVWTSPQPLGETGTLALDGCDENRNANGLGTSPYGVQGGLSGTLFGYANHPSIWSISAGTLTINLDNTVGNPNVVNLTLADIGFISDGVVINPDPDGDKVDLLINVGNNGTNATIPTAGTAPGTLSFGAAYEVTINNNAIHPDAILWNFTQTGFIQMDTAWTGSVLAPCTAIQNKGNSLDGSFVVGRFQGYAPNETVSVGNRFWFDKNNNGVEDSGEPGLAGLTVSLKKKLYNADGTVSWVTPSSSIGWSGVTNSTTTDSNGYFKFNNLAPGEYVIESTQGDVTAHLNTIPDSGSFTYQAQSSTTTETDPNVNSDINDNGLVGTSPTGTANVFYSNIIFISPGSEPVETATDPTHADGTNGNLTIDFGVHRAMDAGDLPDTNPYFTSTGGWAPRHLISSTLRLGSALDTETNGQASSDASGDGSDEDGVRIIAGWKYGTVADGYGGKISITISGGSGVPSLFMGTSATKVTLRDITGAPLSTATPWAAGTYTVYIDVDASNVGAGTTGAVVTNVSNIPTRVRLANTEVTSPTGDAESGEVEDYMVSFGPTAVSLSKSEIVSPVGVQIVMAIVLLMLSVNIVLVYFIKRRQAS